MSRRDDRNARAYEHRDDMNVEFVDLSSIEERRDQSRATHHPDVLARRFPEALRKRLHWLRHEFHAWRSAPGRFPREHVIGHVRIEQTFGLTSLLVVIQQPVVGPASPEN